MPPKKASKKKAKRKAPGLAYIVKDLRPLAEPLKKLVADPRNARTHDAANVKSIAASLRKFGQRKPIVVNRTNGQIEAGNGTLLAARELGWSHLAVVWVKDDPAAQRGFAIADNRTAELANWDDALLEEALSTIQQDSTDLYDDLLLAQLRTADNAEQDAAGEQQVPTTFQVIVDCANEPDQKRFYERMQKEKRTCRVLTL